MSVAWHFRIRLRIYHPIFLLAVRGSRPGKSVQLSEAEIRTLCLRSREIFLSQPILLELEAPLKICGKIFGSFPAIALSKNVVRRFVAKK